MICDCVQITNRRSNFLKRHTQSTNTEFIWISMFTISFWLLTDLTSKVTLYWYVSFNYELPHPTFPYCLQTLCVFDIHFPSYSPPMIQDKKPFMWNVNNSTSARPRWHTHDQQTVSKKVSFWWKKKSIECTGAIVKRFLCLL